MSCSCWNWCWRVGKKRQKWERVRSNSAGEKEWERKWDWQEVWRRWNKQGDGHQRGRCRERGLEKWEGRKRGKEQWIFLSLWCRTAFSPSEKPSIFSSSFFPCSLVHPARLHFPPSPCLFALLAFHQSPCSAVLSFHPSTSRPLWPRRHASFDGLCPLLFSSCCVQLVVSQDASLQVLLHQNGTEREQESDNEMLLVENGSTDLLLCLWVFQSMSGLKLTWHFPMLHSVEADGSCSKAVAIISLLFLVEDRVQEQQRKHRQRGRHATSTGQSLHVCWTQAGFYTLLAPYVDKDTIREGEIWHIMVGTRHSAWKGCRQALEKKMESIFVHAPGLILPTHRPHDHRELMWSLNPEARRTLLLPPL